MGLCLLSTLRGERNLSPVWQYLSVGDGADKKWRERPKGLLTRLEFWAIAKSRAKSKKIWRNGRFSRPRLGEAINRSSHSRSKDEDINGSAYRLNLRKDVEVERSHKPTL